MQNISAGTDQNRSSASRLMNAEHEQHFPLSALLYISGRRSERTESSRLFPLCPNAGGHIDFSHRLISLMNIASQK